MTSIMNWTIKIKEDEESLSKIKKLFEIVTKGKQNMLDKRRKNLTKLQDILDDDSPSIQEIYSKVGNNLLSIEDKREESKTKIDQKIIPAFKYIDRCRNEFMEGIRTMQEQDETIVSKKKEKVKLQQKKQNDMVEAINKEIEDMENDQKERKKEHSEEMLKYEKQRICNMKLAFLHYIHSELSFHLSSIDILSKLYKDIVTIQPIQNLKEFNDKYINEDIEKLKNYGYVVDKKNKKKVNKSKEFKPISSYGNKKSEEPNISNKEVKNDDIIDSNKNINNNSVSISNNQINSKEAKNSKDNNIKNIISNDDEFEI